MIDKHRLRDLLDPPNCYNCRWWIARHCGGSYSNDNLACRRYARKIDQKAYERWVKVRDERQRQT